MDTVCGITPLILDAWVHALMCSELAANKSFNIQSCIFQLSRQHCLPVWNLLVYSYTTNSDGNNIKNECSCLKKQTQLVAKSSKWLYIQTLKYNKTVTAHMYAWI